MVWAISEDEVQAGILALLLSLSQPGSCLQERPLHAKSSGKHLDRAQAVHEELFGSMHRKMHLLFVQAARLTQQLEHVEVKPRF
jgi:hypothetical protein